MNEALRERLEQARRVLDLSPDWATAGYLGRPSAADVEDDARYGAFFDFLRICNGARLGGVEFWCRDEFPHDQEVARRFPRRAGGWLVVGQLLYDPLALAEDGEVYVLRDLPVEQSLGTFDRLIEDLLGPAYAEVVPYGEADPWWSFLAAASLR